MIAQLRGTVIQLGPTAVVIEVGGLGVLTLCSPNTTAGLRLGETATIATSLVVREDSLTLYGFATVDERELFELLQTATGVGPKLAQAALAVLSGPEGGLSEAEEAAARAAGFQSVQLGPRILRAETAPLAVLAWLALGA